MIWRHGRRCSKIMLDPDLSLSSAAAQMQIHSVYLSSFFKTNFQAGFAEYVNRKRIENACALMVSKEGENAGLAQIAERSGFASKVTFRREFKNFAACLPWSTGGAMTLGIWG